ncbi:MAG: hypothetical protein E2O52_06000 [Gammaproteobacteria bacterium]|nr:MAG: hypothetical protein E2O52_06000 [Gammaproteobacteria bacterium]
MTMQKEVVITDRQIPADVIRAIADGRKIEAIKMLREATGLGLANAKVLVDRASRVHGLNKPMPSAVTEDAGTGKLLVSLVAVMVMAVAYFFYIDV